MKPPCSYPGCHRQEHARGYCQVHYRLLRQQGKIAERNREREPDYSRVLSVGQVNLESKTIREAVEHCVMPAARRLALRKMLGK